MGVPTEGDQLVSVVAETLDRTYDLHATDVTRIPVGTATINYLVTDSSGAQWFVKVYRDGTSLPRERNAVALAEFARADQVPVPPVRRTRDGRLLADTGLPMSVWQYVADAETAEGGLTGRRWQTVGAVLGRLHRRLAAHPAVAPTVRPGTEMRDMQRTRARFDRLITEYSRRSGSDPFEAWALNALEQRRALLDDVGAIVAGLPELTAQVVHGDLAAPNLMLRGDEVAAVIDFQPPSPRFISWELARIGLDPRTVLLGSQWRTGFPELLAAYRDEHPAARLDDLVSTVAVGCAYTLASSYPLAEPLDNPGAVDATLRAYARARHDAALLLLDQLDDIHAVVRDALR